MAVKTAIDRENPPRLSIVSGDEEAAEVHARIRVTAKRLGRTAGAFDIMIAAHAGALGRTLVTNDAAIKNLRIDDLKIFSW
jgi:tRNA(fMet)-specific endonuclease VapC